MKNRPRNNKAESYGTTQRTVREQIDGRERIAQHVLQVVLARRPRGQHDLHHPRHVRNSDGQNLSRSPFARSARNVAQKRANDKRSAR